MQLKVDCFLNDTHMVIILIIIVDINKSQCTTHDVSKPQLKYCTLKLSIVIRFPPGLTMEFPIAKLTSETIL